MFHLNLLIVVAILLLAVTGICAAESVVKIDMLKHEATDKAHISLLDDGVYEWSLPDGLGQTLQFNLDKMGINPHDYDEIRYEIKPLGSQVSLNTMLSAFPTASDVTSWYLKFKAVTGEWTEGRYDLRVDDDGVWYKNTEQAHMLSLRLDRRIMGFPGEPVWRKAYIVTFDW